MEATHNITIYGVELIVSGNFSKGEPSDYEDPGYPDEFEITKVFAEGDISDLLDYFGNSSVLEQIEEEVLKQNYS